MAAVDADLFGGVLRTAMLPGVSIPVFRAGSTLAGRRTRAPGNIGCSRLFKLFLSTNEAAEAVAPPSSIAPFVNEPRPLRVRAASPQSSARADAAHHCGRRQ